MLHNLHSIDYSVSTNNQITQSNVGPLYTRRCYPHSQEDKMAEPVQIQFLKIRYTFQKGRNPEVEARVSFLASLFWSKMTYLKIVSI